MDTSDEEEDDHFKANAFDVLMQRQSKKAKTLGQVEIDPIMIAVIYIRWLRWIDPSEPLYGCPYIGQSVRARDTPEEVATERWKEENRQAVREEKDAGLIHCLDVYGPEAFKDEIVAWRRGPRSEVQVWADELEIELIAENGGPFRDTSVRCKQTLNLTKGGKSGCIFESLDAIRTIKWIKFKTEMEEYVECCGTSLVPREYVNPVSEYKLGQRLSGVRCNGELWKGHPDEAARVKWLEALPKWAWDARKTDELKEERSERAQEWHDTATPEQLADWSRKQSESHSTPEYKAAASKRSKAQVEREAAEGKVSLVERGKATRIKNWTKEQRDAAQAKRNATSAAKRAKVLESLPTLARKKKENEYACVDRKEATRKGKANALLQLPAYSDKGCGWCYKNLPQAQKDGVVFSKDANGVWCARVRGQGERVGSSADHAALT